MIYLFIILFYFYFIESYIMAKHTVSPGECYLFTSEQCLVFCFRVNCSVYIMTKGFRILFKSLLIYELSVLIIERK